MISILVRAILPVGDSLQFRQRLFPVSSTSCLSLLYKPGELMRRSGRAPTGHSLWRNTEQRLTVGEVQQRLL